LGKSKLRGIQGYVCDLESNNNGNSNRNLVFLPTVTSLEAVVTARQSEPGISFSLFIGSMAVGKAQSMHVHTCSMPWLAHLVHGVFFLSVITKGIG
jgi:hypothetical protein